MPRRPGLQAQYLPLYLTDEGTLTEDLKSKAWAVLVIRGGPNADSKDRNEVHTRRRYNLLGQTLDGMRVWDIRRGVDLLRSIGKRNIFVIGSERQRDNALIAKLFSPEILQVTLGNSSRDADRPDYLNLLRFTSWNELEALASQKINEGQSE